MLEIIIIALLIAVLASLQSLKATQKKTNARIEIELFHAKQNARTIIFNLQNLIEWLPSQLDNGAAFNHLRNATNDEALHKVAIEAVLLSRPGALILFKKHARKAH